MVKAIERISVFVQPRSFQRPPSPCPQPPGLSQPPILPVALAREFTGMPILWAIDWLAVKREKARVCRAM